MRTHDRLFGVAAWLVDCFDRRRCGVGGAIGARLVLAVLSLWLVAAGGCASQSSSAADPAVDTWQGGADAQAADQWADTLDPVDASSPADALDAADVAGSPDAVSQTDSYAADGPWQSALVKDGWHPMPGPDGGRLIDYSWAGYHHGEVPIPTPATPVINAATLGADPTGAVDSTAAIQAAIDKVAAGKGGVVYLPAGLYRIDGTLLVSTSATVLRGDGPSATRLWFTRHLGMSNKAHLTFQGKPKADMQASAFAGESKPTDRWPGLHVSLPSDVQPALQPGDDLAVTIEITEGFVAEHGMTGTWKAFNGQRVRLFRTRFVKSTPAFDGATVLGMAPGLPYRPMFRDKPRVERISGYLRECGVEDLAVANAVNWEDAWANNQVHAIEFNGVADCWARRVHSFDPPGPQDEGLMPGAHLQSGGIRVHDSTRVTVQDCALANAQNRGGGGNGYLFEIRQSTHVLTRDCKASKGRHNFIQNWGFGTAGCVWTGIHSAGGTAMFSKDVAPGLLGMSEFHHSLAMFNLVEDSVIDDGWASRNRGDWSTGAGHTATENTLWNIRGSGLLMSRNYGHGYVVGTGPKLDVQVALDGTGGEGTAPLDWVEGQGKAATLEPQSLWASQLKHRLGQMSDPAPP